jgi:hypothetical protein
MVLLNPFSWRWLSCPAGIFENKEMGRFFSK